MDTLGYTISIHALHEESDGSKYQFHRHHSISIHALHEESDLCALGMFTTL